MGNDKSRHEFWYGTLGSCFISWFRYLSNIGVKCCGTGDIIVRTEAIAPDITSDCDMLEITFELDVTIMNSSNVVWTN
ncbi:hypothetical protein EPI10_001903 [Gossypium australe]|uniref:Uncharacterized protein n=1 Tax=Gossypium australe TaxID=47621 RepID=A0A5B6VCF3_9ROSI|nr:hypothetical protein EPI10_001903 [Gossypium australe]